MAKSRATKMALASLMATSAIVPAMAVSANIGETINVNGTEATTRSTPDGEYTINFTITDTTNHLAKYITGPAKMVITNGKMYIQPTVDATALKMLTKVEVAGESVLKEVNGVLGIYIPVANPATKITGEGALNLGGTEITTQFEMTLDSSSIKPANGTEEKPETPEKPTTPYGEIQDGKYEVTFDAYNPKTGEGNYSAITRQLESKATLVVENGKYFLEVSGTKQSNSMIPEYQVLVDGKYVKAETVSGSLEHYPHIVRLPLASLNDLTTAKLHVVAGTHDQWYDFQIAVDKGLDLPEKEAVAETLSAYVYKDGENELSIMQGKYLANTVQVTSTESGYNVDVTFPEGQHLKGFTVEGATVAKKSEEVVGANTVKIYTVEVKDLTKIYNATVDLSVRFGDFSYDEVYKTQLQFGGKQNPFKDIQHLKNYGPIVHLYSKGIFAKDTKFNPANPTTREHFSLMLFRALDLEVPATTGFKDIASLSEGSQKAIKALNHYGIIAGVSKDKFAPKNGITREQAAKMIYRLLVKEGYVDQADAKMPFSDVSPKDAELNKAAAQLNALGIMNGYNGKLSPKSILTREQMAIVLNKALPIIEELK